MALDYIRFFRDKLNLNKFKKLYYYEKGKKFSLDIGAFESQEMQFSNTITDNPVEFGANLADHIYRNPVTMDVVVIVGDSTGFIASVIDKINDAVTEFSRLDFTDALVSQGLKLIDASESSNIRSSKVYNKLINLQQNFAQVEIITRDRIYKSLQIQNISRNISVDNYGGAVIQMSLKELMVFGTNESNVLTGQITQNGFMSPVEMKDDLIARFTS